MLSSHSRHDSGLPTIEELLYTELHSSEVQVYEKKELGTGSYGSVCLGSYYGCTVAIKKIKIDLENDPDIEKYLRREVELLKTLRHPNIVQFLGVLKGTEKNGNKKVSICTEFMEGGDMENWLKREFVSIIDPDWNIRLKIAQDVASAMCYLHGKKVLYRDLKGKNILLDQKHIPRSAKLCDFGLARTYNRNPLKKSSKSLTLCGTNEWMAPEVLLGRPYDKASDVFSMGMVLLEMTLGVAAVKQKIVRNPSTMYGIDVPEVTQLIVESGCPQGLAQLALECLVFEPLLRPDFPTIFKTIRTISEMPFVPILPPDQAASTLE